MVCGLALAGCAGGSPDPVAGEASGPQSFGLTPAPRAGTGEPDAGAGVPAAGLPDPAGAGALDGGGAAEPDAGMDYGDYQVWFTWAVMRHPAGEFESVSVSDYSACGVRVGGQLVCWGEERGRGLPVGEFARIWGDGANGCALEVDGSLACWPSGLPSGFRPEGEFVDVTASWSTGVKCAVRVGGEVQCFVAEGSDWLEVPDGEFSQVTAKLRVCGLTVGGELVCWGDLWSGDLASRLRVRVFEKVSEAGAVGCAVSGRGELECWSGYYPLGVGVNLRRELGIEFKYLDVSVANPGVCVLSADGDAVCRGTGVDVVDTDRVGPFEQISASGGVVCALRVGGGAQCWGERPGRGANSGPGDWERPAGEFAQVAVYAGNGAYACGVRADTAVACWDHRGGGGWDDVGPMGWMAAKPDGAGFAAVAVAESRACALEAGGAVACWGAPADKAAQDNNSAVWSPPGEFTQITATGQRGRGSFCGLLADASLLCWSESDDLTAHDVEWARLGGGCGLRPGGQIECRAHVHRDLPPDGTGPLARAAHGRLETCGIRRADSSIACWENRSGLPTKAPPGAYTHIEASNSSGFCAIATDASLACWDNRSHTYHPQALEERQMLLDAPSGQFTEIAVGNDHACAIRTDKTLACWGPAGSYYTVTAEPSAR
ncbi:hypothetical protein [Candidatus Poriferisocius sp.]|uniref:hypothetical protein n=1 Tax=Candidatus Poriferisocius sp. TaxID=3101276 RepID=UPI003B015AD5